MTWFINIYFNLYKITEKLLLDLDKNLETPQTLSP